MKRRSLLKGFGLLGVGVVAPPLRALGLNRRISGGPACWLTPETTAGPYYFDPNLIRLDITGGSTGVPLSLGIGVVDRNCRPVPNMLVDLWHADRRGLYSGYAQPHGNTTGETFLRGTQPTDATGTSRFDTIYPGWYPGRATHIHFKVRIPDRTYVTSQFAFDDLINDAVYATPLYTDRGPNPVSNAEDGIFQSPHPQHLEAELEASGQGYTGTYIIGIDADLSIFIDGFESGDLSMWSEVIGATI